MGYKEKKKPKAQEISAAPHQIRLGATPQAGKHARAISSPSNYHGERPSWHVGQFDFEGPYCFSKVTRPEIPGLLARLKGFESMRWGEILGDDNHAIAVERLSPDSRERLEELALDDLDEIISLRVGSKPRIIGIRDGTILRLLWWDPEHKVCPSPLKHT